jgi:hypothetical protein
MLRLLTIELVSSNWKGTERLLAYTAIAAAATSAAASHVASRAGRIAGASGVLSVVGCEESVCVMP